MMSLLFLWCILASFTVTTSCQSYGTTETRNLALVKATGGIRKNLTEVTLKDDYYDNISMENEEPIEAPDAVDDLTPSQPSEASLMVETVEDILADEALRLIAEGEKSIELHSSFQDIILVIGNTGAGKTTITKFLTEVEKLTSYDAGDRFLIQDADHKISQSATIVSKTIFPELILENSTGSAFYDLPGFSDTRNASVEIANAWFMKKVAEHAQRVKLLFIVNYFSLRKGEARTNFKTFLDHATDLVPDPAKFKDSIALIATKVESSRGSDKIIRSITNFLESALNDLPDIFPEDSKRKVASDLIHAVLETDADGNHNRISFFKQPDDEGSLVDIPYVMAQRPHMLNVLHYNTNFTQTSSADFDFSLSPAAKLVLVKVGGKIQEDVATTLGKIAEEISYSFENVFDNIPLESFGELLREQMKVEDLASNLASSASREIFLENVIEGVTSLVNVSSTQTDIERLETSAKRLRFFEKIGNLNFTAPILTWAYPFKQLLKALSGPMRQKADALNLQMTKDCVEIGARMDESIQFVISNGQPTLREMENILTAVDEAKEKLLNVTSQLQQSTSIQRFVEILETSYRNERWRLLQLTEDIEIENGEQGSSQYPFQKQAWLQPFEQAALRITEEESKLRVKIENEKHRLEMEEAARQRELQLEEQARRVREHQDEQRRLREDAERRRRAYEAELDRQERIRNREIEAYWRQIRRQQQEIEEWRSRPKKCYFLGFIPYSC